MSKVRIVIFSSDSPLSLDHFIWRLERDLPTVQIAGLLYEQRRSALSRGRRVQRALRLAGDKDFRALVRHRIGQRVDSNLEQLRDVVLRFLHAAPKSPNGPAVTLDTLIAHCDEKHIPFHLTQDIHDSASLQFVRDIAPDIGLIYGTRILKPELFSIPTRGSINIHKHKLPDYRGAGAAGLWELRDHQTEATVSVHRVLKEVDAGPILGEISFSIEPFDTLESIGLKADLLGIDLLIDVLRKESLGQSSESPQVGPSSVYKGFQAHQIFAIKKQIQAHRSSSAFKPSYTRPSYKLILRTLMYPGAFLRNLRRRRQKAFPVVILFHHLITDKPKDMGISTAQFAAQIRFLKKHYRIVSLPEAISQLRQGEVPAPTVALTFDDGYAENFLCLRAVAERERTPIGLFVCTGHVSEGNAFQHDLDRKEVGFAPLTWNQLRYFVQHDVVIGSHTRTHFDCGATEERTLTEEIVGSRDDLFRELGPEAATYFAFPKGHPNNMSAQAVEIASKSYDVFFSANGGVNYTLSSESQELFRCSHPDSVWELELLMQGLLEFRDVGRSHQTEPHRLRAAALPATAGHTFIQSSRE